VLRKNRRGIGPVGTGQVIHSILELDELENQVIAAAKRTVESLRTLLSEAEPLHAFAQMKFQLSGCHPTADRSLNLIEQINQTFTYLASAQATRWLFQHHPDAAPFRLNLGTTGGTDIESIDGSVAAETFASVDPRNNRKLEKDIDKVGCTAAVHKYVFYICPRDAISEATTSSRNEQVKIVSLGWK
jgi:hypothetical protein